MRSNALLPGCLKCRSPASFGIEDAERSTQGTRLERMPYAPPPRVAGGGFPCEVVLQGAAFRCGKSTLAPDGLDCSAPVEYLGRLARQRHPGQVDARVERNSGSDQPGVSLSEGS